jgi:uncharacterized membrane protein YgcG
VVVDGAGLFTAEDSAKIEALGADLLQSQGVVVRVVTMAEAGSLSPKTIAVTRLNRWGLGPKGVILLILIRPQAVYLQPGSDLAPSFDEHTSATICSLFIAPQVRAHAFGAAALAGLTAIRNRLLRPAAVSPRAMPPGPPHVPSEVAAKVFDPSGWILALVLSIFPAYWILARVFGRKCSRCRARMRKTIDVIQDPTHNKGGAARTVYTCTACGNTETRIDSIGPLDTTAP